MQETNLQCVGLPTWYTRSQSFGLCNHPETLGSVERLVSLFSSCFPELCFQWFVAALVGMWGCCSRLSTTRVVEA